jgi:hypothetical protein
VASSRKGIGGSGEIGFAGGQETSTCRVAIIEIRSPDLDLVWTAVGPDGLPVFGGRLVRRKEPLTKREEAGDSRWALTTAAQLALLVFG